MGRAQIWHKVFQAWKHSNGIGSPFNSFAPPFVTLLSRHTFAAKPLIALTSYLVGTFLTGRTGLVIFKFPVLQWIPVVSGASDLSSNFRTFTDKLLNTSTHWGLVTHICVSRLPIINSDNGLSPGRRHAIFWTNAGILLIEPLGTISVNYQSKFIPFHSRKYIWKCRLGNVSHVVSSVKLKLGTFLLGGSPWIIFWLCFIESLHS